MNKFVMMYYNIWTTRLPGECWKALHQPEVICTRLGRPLSIHPAIDKKSEEYAPIPLNIVCAVIHYLIFLYKN